MGLRRQIREFLVDEDRAYRILIDTATAIAVVSFVIAVAAIMLMR